MNNRKIEFHLNAKKNELLNLVKASNWETAQRLLLNDELQARYADPETGLLPLHYIIIALAPLDVTLSFIRAYPDSLKKKIPENDNPIFRKYVGMLPLHIFFHHGIEKSWIHHLEYFTVLYENYPDALKEIHFESTLSSLHLALKHHQPQDIILEIIHLAPELLNIPDKNNNYPIHYALFYEASDVIIINLITRDPLCLKKYNNKNQYPIHFASFKNVSYNIMKKLIEESPDTLNKKDLKGNLPIHYIYLHANGPSNEHLLKIFLKTYPQGLSMTNLKGLTPLMMPLRSEDYVVDDFLL